MINEHVEIGLVWKIQLVVNVDIESKATWKIESREQVIAEMWMLLYAGSENAVDANLLDYTPNQMVPNSRSINRLVDPFYWLNLDNIYKTHRLHSIDLFL